MIADSDHSVDAEGANLHDHLQFLYRIPQHLLQDIQTSQPPPSVFCFDATDAILAGRTLRTTVWTLHNEQHETNRAPLSGSTLFALNFSFKICDQPIVRYYSSVVGAKIWFHCQTVAQKYGIEPHSYGGLDVHPIHRSVECCFACNKKPKPLFLTIPEELNNRQQYLVWMNQFLRESYELLLDESLKSLSTTCWNLEFAYLDDNTSAAGTFKATAIVRPITNWGRTFKDDFAMIEITELPRKTSFKKMAVVIRPTYRWMVNRHTNARPDLVDLMGEPGEALSVRLRGTESDENFEDSQDSEAESVRTLRFCRDSEPESEAESETDTIPIEPASGVSGLSGGLGSESDEEYYDDSQNAIIDLLFDILFAIKSDHHQSDGSDRARRSSDILS